MCVCFLALKKSRDYPFILAHNRDEFYDRPATPAHFWKDHPSVLAGIDLKKDGTWLGITTAGKIALVTNFRKKWPQSPDDLSRGMLVKNYLTSPVSAQDYLGQICAEVVTYPPLNFIFGDLNALNFFSTERVGGFDIPPGTHGLSNHLLNTPWPKVATGIERFSKITAEGSASALVSKLFDLLADETLAPEESLPQTGITVELERQLSPIFVRTPLYGTRASTVILVSREGAVTFTERTYAMDKSSREIKFSFKV